MRWAADRAVAAGDLGRGSSAAGRSTSRRCGPSHRTRRDHARRRDPQRRIASEQVPRRPQPGEPGTDDRDVDVDRTPPSRVPSGRSLLGKRVGPHDRPARSGTRQYAMARVARNQQPAMLIGPIDSLPHRHAPPTTHHRTRRVVSRPVGVGQRYFDGRDWATPTHRVHRAGRAPQLPFEAALGALVVLTVSLIAGKAIVDSLFRFDWPVIVVHRDARDLRVRPVARCGVPYVRRRWGAGRLSSLGWRSEWSDLAGLGR